MILRPHGKQEFFHGCGILAETAAAKQKAAIRLPVGNDQIFTRMEENI